MVQAACDRPSRCRSAYRPALRHQIRRGHRFELADGVGVHRHRRVLPRPLSAQYCARNSMSAMPPGSCLRSNCSGAGARQLAAHAVAHVRARPRAACSRRTCAPAPRVAPPRTRAQQRRSAGHGARVQQRLVLPGPGLVALVVGERLDAGDQHAALAARPQPHIDLVQPPGAPNASSAGAPGAARSARRTPGCRCRAPLRSPAARRSSRAGTPDRDPRHSRAPCRRACRSRSRTAAPARRAAPSPHRGTPSCGVSCCQASCSARSMISSAMSVRRSLTCMTGSRASRSATAEPKHARRAGSDAAARPAAPRPPASTPAMRCARSAASAARSGGCSKHALVDQLIEQQRMRRDLIDQEIAVRCQPHQARARARALCSSSAK